jgi:transcriptional repressor NrdR
LTACPKIFFDVLYVELRIRTRDRYSIVARICREHIWSNAEVVVRILSRRRFTVRDTGPEMRCPFCKEDRDRVIDSRSSDGGRVIRRRRQCLVCKKRFTTYEKIGESFKLYVAKKDSARVPYDRDKIVVGVQKACYKRPVSAEQIQEIVDKVEETVFRHTDKEISSAFIGESVMEQLRRVDKVAYIRFASVYRDFRDAGELIKEVSEVIRDSEHVGQRTLFEK